MSNDKSSKSSKQNNAPTHVKRGSVIDRRRNRTVNQDVAASQPKWQTMDGTAGRVLVSAGRGQKQYIRRGKNNKWESVCLQDIFAAKHAAERGYEVKLDTVAA